MKNDTAKEKRLNCWNGTQHCSFSARKGAQERPKWATDEPERETGGAKSV